MTSALHGHDPTPHREEPANPGRANPKAAGDSRANLAGDLPDATNLSPSRPAPHIQVGDSLLPLVLETRYLPPGPKRLYRHSKEIETFDYRPRASNEPGVVRSIHVEIRRRVFT